MVKVERKGIYYSTKELSKKFRCSIQAIQYRINTREVPLLKIPVSCRNLVSKKDVHLLFKSHH